MEDTNLEGVSLSDVAALIEEEDATEEIVEESAAEELEGDDQQPEEVDNDDSEEVEYEGKAYKVPKELKNALLRHSDYTVKTQEVAEQRRSVEERAQMLEQQQRLLSASFDKAVELKETQKRLAQYEQIDWSSLADADPVQATKLNIQYQQLQREAAQKYQELQQTQAQNEQLTQHQRQQMLAQAQGELKQRLPNFDASTAEKIKTAARDYGISDNELNSLIDPRYVHVLHDAMKWRALQAEKPKAMQRVAEAPKAIKSQAKQPSKPDQSKLDRLKKTGSVEALAAFF